MTHAPAAPLSCQRTPLPARPARPWRGARVALGYGLLGLGAIGALLPFHLGLPVMVAGLAVVLRNSMQARRLFVRLQRRKPNWVYPLRRLLRPKPQFLPVMWQGMLRTERFIERFILRRAFRIQILGRFRRKLRRRLRAV